MQINPYYRKAFFHETDQMGIIHHSNYLKWFEESRFDLLEQLGFGMDFLEREGLSSPVLDIACSYKAMVHFNDEVAIKISVKKISSARLIFSYNVWHDGEIKASGESGHCFINQAGKIISLKREYPELHEILSQLVVK
ncbi:acyl-CoA thioesterase [Carnobacterium gallinarum]|uniref:acyl-CoA thioesterase n=1 Tax=Carnobacterium gallinarum TaxID=2749 RepID=UPI000556A068|nr:thioesterase family protein [Carnobacterium gallinarum]